MKYTTKQDLYLALVNGLVKRSSISSTCRRLKKEGRDEDEMLYRQALLDYDIYVKDKGHYICSVNDKLISVMTLTELVDLYDKDSRLFTSEHAKRYGELMLGGTGIVLWPEQVGEM